MINGQNLNGQHLLSSAISKNRKGNMEKTMWKFTKESTVYENNKEIRI